MSTRRYVGGILNAKRGGWVKTRKYEHDSCHKVICKPCISTGVSFHTQQFASTLNFTTLRCCNTYTSNMAAFTDADSMTSLSSLV